MMNSFTAFSNKFSYCRIIVRRSSKFDHAFSDVERSDTYTLIFHNFMMNVLIPQQLCKKRFRSSQIFYGNTEMRNTFSHKLVFSRQSLVVSRKQYAND